MIAEKFMDALAAFVRFIIGLLPTAGPPSWMDDGSSALAQVWLYGAGLGNWIPWGYVAQVVGAVAASVVIGFGIKVTRIIASFLTVGGGSAG